MERTPSMAGARANPAGNPGMGSGNVPFAPGVMSGNLGTNSPAPLARQMTGSTVINIGGQGEAPSANPPGQVPQPAPQQPSMAGPMMAQFFAEFLQAYMASLLRDVSKPIVGGIY